MPNRLKIGVMAHPNLYSTDDFKINEENQSASGYNSDFINDPKNTP